MNLDALDLEKARAHDALLRGHFAEAQRAYEALEPYYRHHRFDEGLLGLSFNRFLVALECGERRLAEALAGVLVTSLAAQAPPVSPLVGQVATGIVELLRRELPGIARETADALGAAALPLSGPAPPDPPVDTEALVPVGRALPRPGAVAALAPEDAALVMLSAARPTSVSPVARALAAELAPAGAAGAAPLAALDTFRDAVLRGDALRAYPALVEAYEQAAADVPALAAELAIGLTVLEAEGLPDRVEFAPGLPRERRLGISTTQHGRLAEVLGRHVGWELAALTQWRHVVGLAEAGLERVRSRAARGAARAVDFKYEAEVTWWHARALRALGEPKAAFDVIEGCVRKATRAAYDDVDVAARIVAQAAELAERVGDLSRAAELYVQAAEMLLPGVARAGDIRALVDVADAAAERAAPGRICAAVRALAGEARAVSAVDRAQRLERARTLAALARPNVPEAEVARALLDVELSAARAGDEASASRAIEAARVTGDPTAIALAMLLRASAALAGGDLSFEERGRALADLSTAAGETRRAPASAVRRVVETTVALAHLDGGEGTDPQRVDVHVRRAAEVCEAPGFRDGAGDLDVFLPRDPCFTSDHFVRRLVDEGAVAEARRFCAAQRRRDQLFPVGEPARRLERATREIHRRRFEARWGAGGGERPSEVDFDAWRPRPERAPGAPEPDELWLEYRVFEDWMVLFAVSAGGVRVFRWTEPRAALQGRIADLLGALRTGKGTRQAFIDQCRGLHELLIRPLAADLEGVRRVRVHPDGPLSALPFGVLFDEGFLAERFDLSVALPADRPLVGLNVAPPTALIVGDGVTTRDLRLSTLEADGLYTAVGVRCGADLAPGALGPALDRGRVIHLLGAVRGDGSLALRDEGQAVPASTLAGALAAGGAATAVVLGPAESSRSRGAISALLTGVHAGVVARRWQADDDATFALEVSRRAVDAFKPWDLAGAVSAARRAAIRARTSARIWAAFETYVAC